MLEFELNNVRIRKIKVAGSNGIGTTWIGIGTNPILVSGTGTTLSWYRYHFGSVKWYRNHPCLGTGTKMRDCPEMAEFMPFLPVIPPNKKGIHILFRKHIQNGS